MNILFSGSRIFHADEGCNRQTDRQSDRHDEANSRLSQFSNITPSNNNEVSKELQLSFSVQTSEKFARISWF